ncbi:M20/M25/M40 family metallo-hydrolase, partial [candidate division KSB1 bacterium]|nr:M20/M25/M40 family metallo-hydrolase [candidate division KSB1 bacterium]
PELPVIRRLHSAFEEMGVKPDPMVYSGGSDANALYAHGIHTVNVGIGASNAHSTEEKIALRDMEAGAQILHKLIRTE